MYFQAFRGVALRGFSLAKNQAGKLPAFSPSLSCLFLLTFFAPFFLLIHHRRGRWKQGKEAKRVEERVVVVLSVMGNRQKKKLSLDCRITRNYTITFTVYDSCRVRLLEEPS